MIGKQTQYVITSVGPESRLATAIVLILWVSALASAFVDNLPLTTMMVRIAANLANDSELNLPLQPLIWSLSFGACLGGEYNNIGSGFLKNNPLFILLFLFIRKWFSLRIILKYCVRWTRRTTRVQIQFYGVHEVSIF